VLGEQRPAEPAGLPQRRRGTAADDAGAGRAPGELGAAGSEQPPAESLLRVLEGLKRL
jgi:hypothetical protein